MWKKIFWIVATGYFLVSSFFFLQSAVHRFQRPHFLYPDITTTIKIEAGQTENTSKVEKNIAKIFYNKPIGYLQSYLDNAYRSLDIPFLFTLTTGSSMYDDQGPMQMLYSFELLLFIPAVIFLIRSGNKKYTWLLYYFLLAILLPAFFLPSLNQLKLFPEVIGIRLVIIFGWYEGMKKWIKK